MVVSLGIQLGHDSSCAVVVDGTLTSAIQAERLSREKHQPLLSLSNDVPVLAVLKAANLSIDDVDVIVSSFQWAGPGGFGLHRPLIEPGFSLFNPWDERHRVLSHHLAHAHSTFDGSGFPDAAVLVCDYAGSATLNGLDYVQTFKAWHDALTGLRYARAPKVECVSMYRADAEGGYRLLNRKYNLAHPGQGSFVYSVAGLYENVTQYVIGRPSTHGELMALAAYGQELEGGEFDPGPLVLQSCNGDISFRNDWQHTMPPQLDFEQKSCLAWRCQQAAEIALESMARRAIGLAESKNLAVAGGVFLNILANSHLSASGICSRYYVPSAPHDAGVSVGCAFHGARLMSARPQAVVTDRLGARHDSYSTNAAITAKRAFLRSRTFEIHEVVESFLAGKIIARWTGRAEFGPRALGGRSLLASPLDPIIKERLNAIKGRELWRPVAPVIPAEDIAAFFDGPDDSYWMTMSHRCRDEHRSRLPALAHPDNSTRAQALLREHDEQLFSWLKAFGAVSGYPILVNTSLNRRGEPIAETASDAIAIYLDQQDIDWLILDNLLVTRIDPLTELSNRLIQLGEQLILTCHFVKALPIYSASLGNRTWRVSESMYGVLASLGRKPQRLDSVLSDLSGDAADIEQVRGFLIQGGLVPLTM